MPLSRLAGASTSPDYNASTRESCVCVRVCACVWQARVRQAQTTHKHTHTYTVTPTSERETHTHTHAAACTDSHSPYTHTPVRPFADVCSHVREHTHTQRTTYVYIPESGIIHNQLAGVSLISTVSVAAELDQVQAYRVKISLARYQVHTCERARVNTRPNRVVVVSSSGYIKRTAGVSMWRDVRDAQSPMLTASPWYGCLWGKDGRICIEWGIGSGCSGYRMLTW